ncbi:MAG: hypothetical protein ABIJ09_26570 [Pseudomonadota bacterium]
MKSLNRKKPATTQPSKGKKPARTPERASTEAQCCAKVSRHVAGCHD